MLSKLGGMAVLHLQGLQCRYADPAPSYERIITAKTEDAISVIQEVYREELKDELILRRIEEMRALGAKVAVSPTPAFAEHAATVIGKGRIDALVVASTVTTARHISSRFQSPDFKRLRDLVEAPVFVGNCVSYQAAIELMRAGADGVLVGVGPGAACTTRRVLGVGMPQVTAAVDCAAARDDYEKESGKRVPIVLDGGMRVGGDHRESDRGRRGRGDDRFATRRRGRGPRAGIPLGHGDLRRRAAQGYSYSGRHHRSDEADSVGAGEA